MCILLPRVECCVNVNSVQLADGVISFQILADFLPTSSVYYQERDVEISKHNVILCVSPFGSVHLLCAEALLSGTHTFQVSTS